MSRVIRRVAGIEPASGIWALLVDADPSAGAGLSVDDLGNSLGIGCLATLPDGSVYKKTAGTATDWTLEQPAIAGATPATSVNSYIVTDTGVKDLLAAAATARRVLILVIVTTAFANGDGGQPTLTIGEESGSASKFAAAAAFTGAAASTVAKVFGGSLTAAKKLQATLAAGTGTTETGAYTIIVFAFPQ
jgi:hypothetical protein